MIRTHARRKRRGMTYDKDGWATKQEWILFLLKSQKANMGMICSFVKTNPRSARQMITNLRKEGHDISLTSYQDFYEYGGYKP